jgi:hypothetical protein
MKKLILYISIGLLGVLLITTGCQEDYKMADLVAPTNVTLTYEIVGADGENPNGDGSGLVNFTALAEHAITYTYDFGDGRDKQIAPDGKITYQFSTSGVNVYHVTVSAVGSGGITSTSSDQVEVLSTFEDAEAFEFLTGGSSKTWYWAADQTAHAGMGPTSEDYGNLDYTWPNWWQIGPWDTDKACMYDAEFVFTAVNNKMTFEQTQGLAWIPGTYAGKIGVDGDACYGEDVATPLYGVKNVSFVPSTSKASIDGGYRGTTMIFSDGGFMCWWVGASEYDIIEVTDNILRVRIKEDESASWYHIFTSEKPEQ